MYTELRSSASLGPALPISIVLVGLPEPDNAGVGIEFG
jgi:hypothetical protein